MRGPILSQIAIVILFGCRGSECPPTHDIDYHSEDPKPAKIGLPCTEISDPSCEEVDPHAADAVAASYMQHALVNLLVARRFAQRVSATDEEDYERLIRELLNRMCGFQIPTVGAHRKAVLDATSLDELFPPADLETAVRAGCGYLDHPGNKRTFGKNVSWGNN